MFLGWFWAGAVLLGTVFAAWTGRGGEAAAAVTEGAVKAVELCIAMAGPLALWAGLAAFAWFGPAAAFSDAERRPLEQFPEIYRDIEAGEIRAFLSRVVRQERCSLSVVNPIQTQEVL